MTGVGLKRRSIDCLTRDAFAEREKHENKMSDKTEIEKTPELKKSNTQNTTTRASRVVDGELQLLFGTLWST